MEETEYMTLLREKYTPPDDASYEEDATFLWLLNGPVQCGVEDKMLDYMGQYPNANAKELYDFFFSLFPDGLPEECQVLDDEESQLCPVCGQYDFGEDGDFEECPVCGWVNDGVQRADPDYSGGYNRISLNDARKKWKSGARVWD